MEALDHSLCQILGCSLKGFPIKLKKEDVIDQYRTAYEAIPQEALELDLRVTVRTIQALAKGKPVSPSELAGSWEMPTEQVKEVLAGAAAAGRAEMDDHGNVVGGVLSLNPTEHRISIRGNELYAWCAYDALYAPGVVGESARVESTDPVSGALIQIAVKPNGVEAVQPEGAVVTVVGGETDMRGGPISRRCTQMRFFESYDSAEKWLAGRGNIAILTIEEAIDLIKEFQIEPAKELGLV